MEPMGITTLVGSALNTYWGALAVDVSRSSGKLLKMTGWMGIAGAFRQQNH